MHAADMLSQRARLTPDREALYRVATGIRNTFAELNTRANRLANALCQTCGVRLGDRVAILAHNSVAFLDLLDGLAKIGAIFSPLNWRLTGRELSTVVTGCSPRVLIIGPDGLAAYDDLKPLIDMPVVLALDSASLDGTPRYGALLAGASSAEPERPTLSDDSPCTLLYTSGTTGKPKGALLPHRQILWNAINTVFSWGLNEDDV
jgi:fatty-acyl-CoA synthase